MQISECSITFNAKISSVTTASTTSNSTVDLAAKAGGTYAGVTASLSASFSAQETKANSNSEQREFSMNIYVHASQAPLPAGTAKLLSILEEAVIISIKQQAGLDL